jgi:hypothetical protein
MRSRALLGVWAALAAGAWLLPSLLPAPVARADFPKHAPGILAYQMHAQLDADTHDVRAGGTLRWRNTSPVPVTDMRLHLYLNAFRDERSTFMRETHGRHRGHPFDPAQAGWIDLLSFKPHGGEELVDPKHLEYLHEDDGNPDDRTVVRIPLPQPIAPGATATFDLVWRSHMPRVFARTGEAGHGAFFMVAQWYPKPGVWQQEPVDGKPVWRWNCHQFHGNSEFYADYGAYDVDLTVPARFAGRVGATGKRQDLGDGGRSDGGRANEDGSVTYRYRAEDVHDFAWVCGARFEIHVETFKGGYGTDYPEQQRVARILGVKESDLDLPPVEVYFLLQPEHADQLERHETAIFDALTYMGFWFGPYPYPTLTVVDPDHRAPGAGGMEYPTLICGGTGYRPAARQLSPEGVLVHEFGHQHFYGLVGSNEFEDAWMDEGMNTYGTAKVLMKAYHGWAAAVRYAGLPCYGTRPFDFGGLSAQAREAAPFVGPLFDRALRVPFGRLDAVRSLAAALGVHHPPATISLWSAGEEVTPLSFLREVPPLTLLHVLPSTSREWERSSRDPEDTTDPIAGRKAWEYLDGHSYAVNSYRRTASSLRTLEGYLGEPTMLRAMHTYCEHWRFRHPRPQDFFDVVEQVAKKDGKGDVRWLLQELFERATSFDFGIGRIRTRVLPPEPGTADGRQAPVFESMVVVRRHGGVRMPIDVRLRLADGSVRDFLWDRDDELRAYAMHLRTDGHWERGDLVEKPVSRDGPRLARVTPARGRQQRWVKIRLRGASAVVSAEVDPYRRLGLDRDRTNDARSTRRNAGASLQIALRALGWVEMGNSFYGGL